MAKQKKEKLKKKAFAAGKDTNQICAHSSKCSRNGDKMQKLES